MNIAWPCGAMGDEEYMAAFMEVIMPVCTAYDPELVIISAGFFFPGIALILMCPSPTRSWIQRYLVWMWRILPIPRRCIMPSAALASAYTDAPITIPRSLAQDWMPRSSHEQATMPWVSASAEDNAMVRCWRDQLLIVCDPIIITPPLVDFLLWPQPAQSESEKP